MDLQNRDCVLKLYQHIYSYKRNTTAFLEIIKKPSHIGFCGYIDNKLVCFISSNNVQNEIDIIELSVIQEMRGRGIGYKVLTYLQHYCTQNEIGKIFLDVAKDNVAAIGLYEKAGFEKIRIRKNYYMLDGYSIDGYEYCWNMKFKKVILNSNLRYLET